MSADVRIGASAEGRAVYELIDEDAGSSALVLPSMGFNLFDLRLPVASRIQPVVAAAKRWLDRPEHPTRGGMPILFPFPNRIRGAAFRFAGRDFALEPNKPPNAIHGFAFDAPFDVCGFGVDGGAAWITGRFQTSLHAPRHARSWPGDPVLELTYRLRGACLELEARVANLGRSRMPWGLGVHSYFHLDAGRGAWSARIPASAYWPLEAGLPASAPRAVESRWDFRQGRALGGATYDDLLTGLAADSDGWSTITLASERLDGGLRLRCDPGFREVVVFTPPWFDDAFAIEPYTCATDAVHLDAAGHDAGLRVLDPGEQATLRLRIEAY